jgi:hypothetical protein
MNVVSRGMAVAWDRGDAGKDFTLSKQPQAVPVGRSLLAGALEVKLTHPLGRNRHFGVVEPVPGFVLVDDKLGIGKIPSAGRQIDQTG